MMLKVENLHKTFGSNRVLNGISFELKPMTITTLLGTNGAGKTTLYNIISGFLEADNGKILFDQKALNGISPAKRTKLGITRTFQDLRLIKELTVKENIVLAMKDNPGENIFKAALPKSVLDKHYDEFESQAENIVKQVFLDDVKNSLAGEISYGQQKLLTLGCCMANNPRLMLLDEPVAGVNLEYRKRITGILQEFIMFFKGTILLIDHNGDFIDAVSDKILFLNEGKITKFQNYNDFKHNDYVKSAYL